MTRIPGTTWRMLSYRLGGKRLPQGLDAAWDAAAGWVGRMVPRRSLFLKRAHKVLAHEKHFASMSDADLRGAARALREVFRLGRDTRADTECAFALIREVADRQVGDRPFPVQIAGAFALDAGCVAEMATGEGKTLTATLPATIAGWRGRGCHVITVNDYLAQRDAEWMGRIYRFCGLNVAHVDQEMPPPQRREAYLADITYCTNKEVTADFLRDRLALGRLRGLPQALLARLSEGRGSGTDRLVQRGLYHAIVDEADSVLIDEAVTPLIISGDAPNPEQVEAFRHAHEIAEQLTPSRDYRIRHRYREVELTNAGKERLRELAEPLGGIWSGSRRREELVTQALTVGTFYARDKQYVVQEGKIVIVDEFTGRLMPDRTWRDGMHQAVEAREDLEVNPPKDTLARISFQRFFRLYRKLSGMTGTAAEAAAEFWQIYHMPVVVIPTNRPCIRKVLSDRAFATSEARWRAVVAEIVRVHATGRPILVGTRSVRSSEHLSRLLQAEDLEHSVLNAVRHREEAQIVAGAGQPGCITVATNMAGRGTDIKLGRGVTEKGGLFVLATERHEAGRIDRQLFGRCGRQGDPGTAQAFVSLEDELVARYAPHLTRIMRQRFGSGDGSKAALPLQDRPSSASAGDPSPAPEAQGAQAEEPLLPAVGTPQAERKRPVGKTHEISGPVIRRLFDSAQRRAERMALRQRKGVLQTDDWLDEYLGFAGSER